MVSESLTLAKTDKHCDHSAQKPHKKPHKKTEMLASPTLQGLFVSSAVVSSCCSLLYLMHGWIHFPNHCCIKRMQKENKSELWLDRSISHMYKSSIGDWWTSTGIHTSGDAREPPCELQKHPGRCRTGWIQTPQHCCKMVWLWQNSHLAAWSGCNTTDSITRMLRWHGITNPIQCVELYLQ